MTQHEQHIEQKVKELQALAEENDDEVYIVYGFRDGCGITRWLDYVSTYSKNSIVYLLYQFKERMWERAKHVGKIHRGESSTE